MRHFLFIISLTLGLSSSADLQRFAIVKGTNVLFWTQYDTLKPPMLPSGSTNVSITEAEATVIGPGWSHIGGVFRDRAGQPIANGVKTRIDREKLLAAAIVELDDMQTQAASALTNWATMTAGQKDASAKRVIQAMKTVSEILELLLREQRNLLEIKEDAK